MSLYVSLYMIYYFGLIPKNKNILKAGDNINNENNKYKTKNN